MSDMVRGGQVGAGAPASRVIGKPPRLSKRGKTEQGKLHFLNRGDLDGRSNAAKTFDRLVVAIHSDLGGRDRLSAIELALAEAFAGATLILNDLNTRVLGGAEVDNAFITAHAASCSAMVRIGGRLGLQRRSRDVTPDPLAYSKQLDVEPVDE
jgi:hypothetical protein